MSLQNGKMLARFDPRQKVWDAFTCDFSGKIHRPDADLVRRMHRRREGELVRREIDDALEVPHHETWAERFAAARPYDMNDEYSCPSHDVWRTLDANDAALGTIDFDGTYRTEST